MRPPAAAAAPPAEMIPHKERSMPSIMEAVAPQQVPTPVPAPKATPRAKIEAPKPAPAPVVESMDMLFSNDEISVPAAPTSLAVEPVAPTVVEDEEPPFALDEPAAQAEIEIEQTEEEAPASFEAALPEPEPFEIEPHKIDMINAICRTPII